VPLTHRPMDAACGSVSLISAVSADGGTSHVAETADSSARSHHGLGSDRLNPWGGMGAWEEVGGGTAAAPTGLMATIDPSTTPVAHLSFPIDLHLLCEGGATVDNPAHAPSPPRVYFTVWTVDGWERHTVQGYGVLDVPVTPGTREATVRTWKPSAPLSAAETEFFLGTAGRLRDVTFAGVPSTYMPLSGVDPDDGVGMSAGPAAQVQAAVAALNKVGTHAVTTGDIAVRVHTATVRYRKQPRPVLSEAMQEARIKTVADIIAHAQALRAAGAAGGDAGGPSVPVRSRRSTMQDLVLDAVRAAAVGASGATTPAAVDDGATVDSVMRVG
jgi:hypothetical protein